MAGTDTIGGKPDRTAPDENAQGDHRHQATGREDQGNRSAGTSDETEGLSLAGARQALMDEGRERIGEARGHIQSLMHQQTGRAADRLGNVAEALHMAARKMAEENGESTVARYTDEAASRVDGFANMLRDASIDDMLAEVEGFARRRPEVFVGAAFAAGFLFSRFFKSAGSLSRSSASHGSATSGPGNWSGERGLGLLGNKSEESDRSRSDDRSGRRDHPGGHRTATADVRTGHWSASGRDSSQNQGWDRPEAGERKSSHTTPPYGSPIMPADRETPVSSGPGAGWQSGATVNHNDDPAHADRSGRSDMSGYFTRTGGSLRPAPEKPGTDKASSEKSGSERQSSERQSSERPSSDSAGGRTDTGENRK